MVNQGLENPSLDKLIINPPPAQNIETDRLVQSYQQFNIPTIKLPENDKDSSQQLSSDDKNVHNYSVNSEGQNQQNNNNNFNMPVNNQPMGIYQQTNNHPSKHILPSHTIINDNQLADSNNPSKPVVQTLSNQIVNDNQTAAAVARSSIENSGNKLNIY